MAFWNGGYTIGGVRTDVRVEAEDLMKASNLLVAQMPEGATYDGISLDPLGDTVLASATAKLVDLGLTPEEAAAVIGTPTDAA